MDGDTTARKYTREHMKNREPVGICSMTRGTHPGLRDNPEGWCGEGGDTCTPMADPRRCMAETNTIL